MNTNHSSVPSVLLVEDDAAARAMIDKYLTGQGYRVEAVDSAERALTSTALGDKYDIVISDVHLPGMSGLDLAAVLLGWEPLQQILLITGDPDEALTRLTLSHGPVSYLFKPFNLADLSSALADATVRDRRLKESSASEYVLASTTAGAPTAEWLEYLDESSVVGTGHADRVARIARILLDALPETEPTINEAELTVAAWSHEIGRIAGAVADPATIAARGAYMLEGIGCAPSVVNAVRHLHERWNGSGAPDGLEGAAIPLAAQVLAVADSIDHYFAAWMGAGLDSDLVVDRVLGLVLVQQGTVFSPGVADAALVTRSHIRQVCRRDPRATTVPKPESQFSALPIA